MTFEWGTEITRRTRGVPFLLYSPRRTHVVDLLTDAAPFGERTHLVQGDRRLSFADTFSRIEAVAGLLHARGLRPGDRLLLQAPNSPEWVITFWAGLRLGALVAPGNSWWSEPEVAHAVRLLDPALVIGDAARLAGVPSGTATLDIATLQDPGDLPAPPRPAADEDDPALLVFTAGTTGPPKGVVLAHRSVIANLHNLLAVAHRLPHQLDVSRAAPVNLQSGPAFHMGGLQSLLLNLLGGATVVFLAGGRFEPGEVLDLIQRERVTVWGAVPTMASRVVTHPDIAGYDLSTVRSITMGGAPVQPRLLADLRTHFPNAQRGLSTIYGMTETGGTVASASGALMAEHPRTAGRGLPVCELRIDNPDAHGDGEILVRTPGQLIGYWGEEHPDVLDADGFVHTGDQGRLVDDLLFVTGRIKDLIIRGGENIAPAHVEAALLTHPQVRNVAVIGRPDPDLGELVAAAVQVDTPDTVTAEALAAHVRPLLAGFAVPAQWWITGDPLPMTDAGKPDKRTLTKTWPD